VSRSDEIRSIPQNKRLHAMIRDISEQVKWAGEYMDEETWKLLLLGAAYGQRMVPNPLDPQGRFVSGQRSTLARLGRSRNGGPDHAAVGFGDEKGVQWRDEAKAA
jgi:hypothetical protein